MNKVLYWIIKIICTPIFFLIFQPRFKNTKNIPRNCSVVLAGNHKSNFDCATVIASTTRPIHFLAKDELLKTPFAFLFKGMGIIPVNRRQKDHNALESAIQTLKQNKVIGIFPEGTRNLTKDVVMPFKFGAVKMASETNSYIVPFSITGKYRPFGGLKITYGKPYKITKDLETENNKLMDKVSKLIKENL